VADFELNPGPQFLSPQLSPQASFPSKEFFVSNLVFLLDKSEDGVLIHFFVLSAYQLLNYSAS
jgi:hypothetical protein